MKMLVSHAFEENTIFNYSEDLHFLPGFGSLNSFSTVEKEHVNIFLIMCPNVLNGHDKWFWVRFTIFKKYWWHRKHMPFKNLFLFFQ